MFIESNINQLRKRLEEENVICFTTDIDWASDYAIGCVLNIFKDYDIPLTAFVTHNSKLLLKDNKHNPKLDLGIHPNFANNSTQGKSINEVIDYCMNLLPNTKVVRCHRWYSSNDIYDEFVKRGILYDSNECTMLDNVFPYIHRSGILRIPTYFEDGAYILHNGNLNFKEVENKYFNKTGLKVINIHPMHMMLNTPYFKYTREIKDKLTPEQWNNLDEVAINKLRYNGIGIRQFIIDLIEFTQKKKIKISTLKNIYDAAGIEKRR